jgi:hypothetical protein
MFKRQMVDLAVPTINIHALARLIGHGPQASVQVTWAVGIVLPASTLIFEKIWVPAKS